MNLIGVADGELRVGAIRLMDRRAADVDAIAVLPASDTITDLVDHTRGVGARSVRKVRLDRIRAGTHVGLVRIHANGMNANANLSWLRDRIRNVFEREDLRTPQLARENRP